MWCLLDYRLPDVGGHEICRRLKAALPEVHVLFLSSYAADTTATAALEAGADGYLLKENDAQKIVDAIHSVCRGGMVIDPAIARAAITHSSGTPGSAAQIVAQLSEQERRVLAEVATGKADKDIAHVAGTGGQDRAQLPRASLPQTQRPLPHASRPALPAGHAQVRTCLNPEMR